MASLKDEIGDFVGIPISFVEDGEQTPESRLVFMFLRYHTNRKRKRAFPGYGLLIKESGLSRQKVAAGIATLESTGWLVKHKKFAQNTEYELRYPASPLSSTMEQREGAALVPLRNDLSSTVEQPPLVTNKIEINKIKGSPPKAYREKPKPPEDKSLYPPPVFPITEPMYLWLAEMCFTFTEPELAEATNAWRESRESKPNHFMRTLTMWQSDWKKFIRIYWGIRQQRGGANGNGHKKNSDDRPVWMASKK